jgi:MFS family permease
MKKWLRRIRGAVLMGLTWAVVWAPVGLLIGMIVDPDGSMDEPWVLVGTFPGFLGGVAFAVVLGIVGRRRRFTELSLSRFAAWGAAAGLLVGALWLFVVLLSDPPRWSLNAVVVGSLTLLSAVSATASLAVARMAEKRHLPGGGANAADEGLTEGEAQELLGPATDLATWSRSAASKNVARPVVGR